MPTRCTSEERQESLDFLRSVLPAAATVYTVQRGRSRSGASRRLDLFTYHEGRMFYLSGHAWRLGLGRGAHPNPGHKAGLLVDETPAELVYYLSRAIGDAGVALNCEVL